MNEECSIGEELSKPLSEARRDRRHRTGIEVEVRVTSGVDISHRPIDDPVGIQWGNEGCRFDEAVAAYLNGPVPRLYLQRGEPTNLKFQPVRNQHIRATQRDQVTRPRVDVVRLLHVGGEDGDID